MMRKPVLFALAAAITCGVSVSAPVQAQTAFPQFELRGGVLAHNRGPVASHTESGPDLNAALHVLLFDTDALGFPIGFYGHVGGVLNLGHGTSYAYSGLNAQVPFGSSGFYAEFGGGFAVHDGNLKRTTAHRRAMGSRVLFRGMLGLGYRINERWSLTATVDHISNGGILGSSRHNKGLDTFGLRIGYSF